MGGGGGEEDNTNQRVIIDYLTRPWPLGSANLIVYPARFLLQSFVFCSISCFLLPFLMFRFFSRMFGLIPLFDNFVVVIK